MTSILVVTLLVMKWNTNNFLHWARTGKNDEFYTQFSDIQNEINAYIEYNPNVFRDKTILLPCDDPEWSNFTKFFAKNFEKFGLKKLISTSFANESKSVKVENYQPTNFEIQSPKFDKEKTKIKWKIYILDHDTNQNWKIDVDDLEREYLEWDWDFRSEEVKKLRDEADIIITNPPFSLFREFVAWIIEANKNFVIIWNQNAITYKEIFPLIKDNKIWLWKWFNWWATHFISDYHDVATASNHIEWMIRVSWVVWFTNLDHGRRHQPLWLMTMSDNIKFSKHKEIKWIGYKKYDNYDAIEIPFTDAIPSDYDWIMWVPISFLNKYNPAQFEIIWWTANWQVPDKLKIWNFKAYNNPILLWKKIYQRIIIRKR